MAVATLPRPPVADGNNLWPEIEQICRETQSTPTTLDPNAELRAQLRADGATIILGIIPETVFDQLRDRLELFCFDKPRWVSDQVVAAWTSTSRTYLNAHVQARRTVARQNGSLLGLAKRLLNVPPANPSSVREHLLTLWPTRTDAVPTGDFPEDGYMVQVTLGLPLARAFKDQQALAKHGHTVGVAAVPGALAVHEAEVRQVILAREDPFAFVRCTRTDGKKVVVIIDQNGQLPGEQAILDWVQENAALAA